MPTVTISASTREKLRGLAEQEGKSVDEYVQELLDRAVIRIESAEDLIKKLGLDEISRPASRSPRKAVRHGSKKRAKR